MAFDQDTLNRFSFAAAELLREALDPEFANDETTFAFLAGPPLDFDQLNVWSVTAEKSQTDIIYLAFEPGRERFGPTAICVFAERGGLVYRWSGCELWAPKGDGPCLAMPKGLNVCFSHDGKGLISHPTRPTKAVRGGVERARRRLLRVAWSVSAEKLAEMRETTLKVAA